MTASPTTIGIVAALDAELTPIVRRLRLAHTHPMWWTGRCHESQVVATRCGIGQMRASVAVEHLIEEFKPEWILGVGFAGAVHRAWRIGDVLLATDVLGEGGACVPMAPLDPVGGIGKPGTLLTIDRIADSTAAKINIRTGFGVDAVDMESAAMVLRANRMQTPINIVRAISDDVDHSPPAWTSRCVLPDGRNHTRAAIRILIARPWRLSTLLKLRQASLAAGEALAAWIDETIRLRPPADAADTLPRGGS